MFFEGKPVPVPPQSSVFPFALPARLSFRRVRSSVRPFPAAAPVIPPPVPRSLFRRPDSEVAGLTTRSSEQRLAAGFVPWLSLSSPASVAELGSVRRSFSPVELGRHVGPCSLRGQRVFPFTPWSRFAFRARRPLRPALPAGIARHSPGWVEACPRSPDSEFHAPNHALQRTAGERRHRVPCFSSRRR